MVRSRKKCNICPTEETWAEAKKRMHDKAENMPFARKLKVLDFLVRGKINGAKTKRPDQRFARAIVPFYV